jgi:cytochrome P450
MAVTPDDHKRIRMTFQRHFTPKRVEATREETRAAADALIRAAEPRGQADLVSDFALPLPLQSISALLSTSAVTRSRPTRRSSSTSSLPAATRASSPAPTRSTSRATPSATTSPSATASASARAATSRA